MARPKRHVPRDASRRRVWVYLAIAVFLAVDVALIVWALTSNAVATASGVAASSHFSVPALL